MNCRHISLCVVGAALVTASGLAFGGPPNRGGGAPVQAAGQPTASTPLVRYVGRHGSNMEPGVAPAKDVAPVALHDGPVVQLALLLDTSNSMDGLIDQAKATLWAIVNELGTAKDERGRLVQLQVALYEYGNNAIPREVGFVRQRTPFTTDLDLLSEQLFGLRTWGGLEYCGQVISTAMHELLWWGSECEAGTVGSGGIDPKEARTLEGAVKSAVRRGIEGPGQGEPAPMPMIAETVEGPVIRIIVIAGNEPFTQGTVAYQDAIAEARSLGVVVNTIHCGPHGVGEETGWADGARLGGGMYASINQNRVIAQPKTPHDARLAELNEQLNATYVGYGVHGAALARRQVENDRLNSDAFLAPQRAAAKASPQYDNRHWDLVDAVKTGTVELGEVEEESLPEPMQGLSVAERKAKIDALAEERKRLQGEILTVVHQRNQFIAERASAEQGEQGLDDALVEALREQVSARGLRVERIEH